MSLRENQTVSNAVNISLTSFGNIVASPGVGRRMRLFRVWLSVAAAGNAPFEVRLGGASDPVVPTQMGQGTGNSPASVTLEFGPHGTLLPENAALMARQVTGGSLGGRASASYWIE